MHIRFNLYLNWVWKTWPQTKNLNWEQISRNLPGNRQLSKQRYLPRFLRKWWLHRHREPQVLVVTEKNKVLVSKLLVWIVYCFAKMGFNESMSTRLEIIYPFFSFLFALPGKGATGVVVLQPETLRTLFLTSGVQRRCVRDSEQQNKGLG